VQLTVTDVAGESASDSFAVTVNNVAPTATVDGANTVAEGSVYTLSVGAIVEPGADTRTSYSINWGDGVVQTLTPAQWTSAAGSFTHTYAEGGNGGTPRTVTVSATDEDGTFPLGSKTLTVSNALPTLALTGAAALNEGGTYTLGITGADAGGANDPLTYVIDWGDGTAPQNVTASQLAALSGNVTHVYADDQDGPVNATNRTISVTVDDGDGGAATQTRGVTVNNVAPTIALSGAATSQVNQVYTLNLGAKTDPGTDTVTNYLIDWGDGSAVQNVTSAGGVAHTFTTTGNKTISVSLIDEDGTFVNPTTVGVDVSPSTATRFVKVGDAVARESGLGGQWATAWTKPEISISHKADQTNTSEAWSAATLHGVSPQTLAGGDMYVGDLGVSGQSAVTSSVRQEIDGKEGLRFALTDNASKVTLSLSRLFSNDDGSLFSESGRLRLFDAAGNVVGETTFNADGASGTKVVTLASATAFTSIEINAGAYNGNEFVYGGYSNANGSFGSGVTTNSSGAHGSDFMVDWAQFELPVVGSPTQTSA